MIQSFIFSLGNNLSDSSIPEIECNYKNESLLVSNSCSIMQIIENGRRKMKIIIINTINQFVVCAQFGRIKLQINFGNSDIISTTELSNSGERCQSFILENEYDSQGQSSSKAAAAVEEQQMKIFTFEVMGYDDFNSYELAFSIFNKEHAIFSFD